MLIYTWAQAKNLAVSSLWGIISQCVSIAICCSLIPLVSASMTVGLLTVVSTLCYLLVESISENAFLRFSFYSFYLSKLEVAVSVA